MCIIVYKRKGLTMPPMLLLENCFNNNPHGAGFMYRHEGMVRIQKGFMTLDALQSALIQASMEVNMKKTDLVVHFRISTTGSTIPQNCHPFPLSNHPKDLKKLDAVVERAIAHNGILHEYAKFHNKDTDMSDTMYFSKMLSGVKERFVPVIIDRYATGSRFVYMSGSKIHLFGMTKIASGEGKGLYVSNNTYQPPYVPKATTYNCYRGNLGSWSTAGTINGITYDDDEYHTEKEKDWTEWTERNRSRVANAALAEGQKEYVEVPGVIELPKSKPSDFKEAWDEMINAELCGEKPSEDLKAEDYFRSVFDAEEARKAIAKYYREKASGAYPEIAFRLARREALMTTTQRSSVDIAKMPPAATPAPQKEILSPEKAEEKKKFMKYLNSDAYWDGV